MDAVASCHEMAELRSSRNLYNRRCRRLFQSFATFRGLVLSFLNSDPVLIEGIDVCLHVGRHCRRDCLANRHIMTRPLRNSLHGPIDLLVILVFDHSSFQALGSHVAVEAFNDLAEQQLLDKSFPWRRHSSVVKSAMPSNVVSRSRSMAIRLVTG